MSIWILFTLLAALMQAIRTAAQKELAKAVSPMATTLVRYLYGLPFVCIYCMALKFSYNLELPVLNNRFLWYATLAAVTQIMATVALVKAITYNNFAVGTTLVKTEALQTAWLGVVFFGNQLTITGWISILIGLVGVLIISQLKIHQLKFNQGAVFGLLAGLGFAFTSLCLREASLVLQTPAVFSAAYTLAIIVSLQTFICFIWILFKEINQLSGIAQKSGISVFVGATSAAGSVGWFTAMTLQNPAIVKTLGQVEFLFTILLTCFYFKEHIKRSEYIGMILIIVSVILLLIPEL